MARPLRPQVENGIYHVFNRGNTRERIFKDDSDRAQFLAILKRVKRLCGWSCFTYCLLVNHYHLVVRTPRANLSRGMARLDSSYAQAFNRRHDRVGHLFQGRYGSRLVQDDEHLLTTLRYVALNPVASALCPTPEDWPWNGHAEILGLASRRVVEVGELVTLIDNDKGKALRVYRAMFEGVHPAAMPPAAADVIAGDTAFVVPQWQRRPSQPRSRSGSAWSRAPT